jgi:hypothetical protein
MNTTAKTAKIPAMLFRIFVMIDILKAAPLQNIVQAKLFGKHSNISEKGLRSNHFY